MSKKNSSNVRRRARVAAGAFVLIGAGSVVAAPIASAFEVYPGPGGGTVILNHQESIAAHNANLGPAINVVLPNYRNPSGESLGAGFDRNTGLAAGVPGGVTKITVEKVPADPTIRIGAYR